MIHLALELEDYSRIKDYGEKGTIWAIHFAQVP